eukprot:6060680-Pleurochrysis_carterae.AAC.1
MSGCTFSANNSDAAMGLQRSRAALLQQARLTRVRPTRFQRLTFTRQDSQIRLSASCDFI